MAITKKEKEVLQPYNTIYIYGTGYSYFIRLEK